MTVNLVEPGANNKAIENIANAVASIIQPYKQQELGLRELMSKNPELAQKLADLEAKQPGSILKMAGPGAAQYFSAMTASPEARADIGTRQQQNEQIKKPEVANYVASNLVAGKPPGAIQQDILQGKLAQQGVAVMADPNVAAAAGYMAALRGKMPGQYESDRQLKRRALAVEKALATPNLQQEWVKLISGKESTLTWLDVSAIAEDPAHKDLIIPYIESARTQRYLAGLKSAEIRAHMQDGRNLNDIFLRRATELMVEQGGTSVAAYLALIGAPEGMVEATGGYTPQQLQDASNTMARIRDRTGVKDAQTALSLNRILLEKWDTYPDEVKQAFMLNMNATARTGGLPYTYVLDDDGNILLFNENGVQIPAETSTYTKTPSEGAPPSLPPGRTSEINRGGGGASTGAKIKQTTPALGGFNFQAASDSAKAAAPVAAAPADTMAQHKIDYQGALLAAPEYTAADIKADPSFKKFTKDEQAAILKKAKK